MTAVTASVLTSESITSNTYTDLTTTTDSVDVTVGASGRLLVCISGRSSNAGTTTGYISYEMSGANTVAADDSKSVRHRQESNSSQSNGLCVLETGLSAGATTVKMKYKGNNTLTALSFSNRYITAIPIEDLTTRTTAAALTVNSEGTSSTSYTDLTTTNDTATVTIGPSGSALVFTYSHHLPNSYISYALSGATTRAADDDHAIFSLSGTTNVTSWGGCFMESGLAAGSTTFKMKYKRPSGVSQNFSNRRIAVIPL